MNQQILAMMNEAEQEMLREIYDGDLSVLDEDDLVALHGRVRRARTKYTKLYRRRAAARVSKDGSRAKASPANARTARKAEVFEDALARVSRQLARACRASAEELKRERLAAARGEAKPKPRSTASKASAALPTEKAKRRTGATKRASAQAGAEPRRALAARPAKR
jgi:hypothetical protein